MKRSKMRSWNMTGVAPPDYPYGYGFPAGTGQIGHGATLFQPSIRQFRDDQKKNVTTVVEVDLPYCLHGLHTKKPLAVRWGDNKECEVILRRFRRPRVFRQHFASQIADSPVMEKAWAFLENHPFSRSYFLAIYRA